MLSDSEIGNARPPLHLDVRVVLCVPFETLRRT